jgi:hypothetical protein
VGLYTTLRRSVYFCLVIRSGTKKDHAAKYVEPFIPAVIGIWAWFDSALNPLIGVGGHHHCVTGIVASGPTCWAVLARAISKFDSNYSNDGKPAVFMTHRTFF